MASRASAIQREIKQTRPFASPAQEALVALLRTTDLVRRGLARTVEPHGITLQQYNVLRILRGADAPLPTLEVAERMLEQTPGITRLIDRLEAKQLVARARRPEDRRQVLCRITERGLRLLAALDGPMRRADVAALGMLSRGRLDELIDLLDRVRAGHT